ncbi:MAG: NAD(P)H-dependent oxidoreductase subunit E [Firmicutes bacterium]|nr:NAD(P)H-dependent oxidoreductase subunit E [Bacillota bacterium]
MANGTHNPVESLIEDLPRTRASLLPALWRLVEHEGTLKRESLVALSELLGVPAAEVYGVASFYALFSHDVPSESPIRICTDVICHLYGADALYAQVRAVAGGLVHESPCLGRCDTPPAALVGRSVVAPASPEGIRRLSQESQLW